MDGVGNERPDPLGEFMDKGGIYAARATSALPHETALDLRSRSRPVMCEAGSGPIRQWVMPSS